MLRVVARWARQSGRDAKLTGVELNARSAQAIREQSADFQNLNAIRGDAFRLPFADNQFDYGMSSLFTHHFKNADVVALLCELARVSRRGVFVIDLYRHPVAYFFYTTIGKLFLHNRLLREDGALSILRSFTPGELLDLGQQAGLNGARVERHFPYRLVLTGEHSKGSDQLRFADASVLSPRSAA